VQKSLSVAAYIVATSARFSGAFKISPICNTTVVMTIATFSVEIDGAMTRAISIPDVWTAPSPARRVP
jgi:hypothetical protein